MERKSVEIKAALRKEEEAALWKEEKATLRKEEKAALWKEEKAALWKEEKAALRKEFRSRRNGLDEARRAEWSGKICRLLLEWEIFRKTQNVYFYYPLGSEADLLPLAEEALGMGKQAAFPRTYSEEMDFYPVADLTDFQEGAFHVMEPRGQQPLQEPAPLILVPGLAFDRRKGRIGYGRGYYDRYIRRFPEAVTVGICFESQLAARIPMEEHDIFMDYLVTNIKIY